MQIGDENVHRVRALMDEVFGEENFVSRIYLSQNTRRLTDYLPGVADYILWYAKATEQSQISKTLLSQKSRQRGIF